MLLVKQIHIGKTSKFWTECDKLCFLSKNLYNTALYAERQSYESGQGYIGNSNLYKRFAIAKQVDFTALPAKVASLTLIMLDRNYKSYFATYAAYQKNTNKFTGVPQPPHFKPKHTGRFITTFPEQAISKKALKKGFIHLSQTDIKIPTTYQHVIEVRIVPLATSEYNIEIVYEKAAMLPIQNENYAGIDIGLSNLATIVDNTGAKPLIINGNPLKSMNQFYNKKLAQKKSKLPFYVDKNGDKKQKKKSNKIKKFTQKRNNKIKDYLHKASRKVVEQLQQNNISKVIIGKNNQWKQGINIGKKNNQNFVAIPHARLIDMITYKCQLIGIQVVCREESYTSKCSFLDSESIRHHQKYKGQRKYRGLFVASDKRSINADVNGAANILKKGIPEAFAKGIEGVLVSPVKVTPKWHYKRSDKKMA